MTIIHMDYIDPVNLKKVYEVAYKIADNLNNPKELFYTKEELEKKELN